jgi:hypothetical protein
VKALTAATMTNVMTSIVIERTRIGPRSSFSRRSNIVTAQSAE